MYSNRNEMLCYHESCMANGCIELIEALQAAGREQRPAHGEVAQLLQNSHPPLLLDLGQGNQIYSCPIAVNVIELPFLTAYVLRLMCGTCSCHMHCCVRACVRDAG